MSHVLLWRVGRCIEKTEQAWNWGMLIRHAKDRRNLFVKNSRDLSRPNKTTCKTLKLKAFLRVWKTISFLPFYVPPACKKYSFWADRSFPLWSTKESSFPRVLTTALTFTEFFARIYYSRKDKLTSRAILRNLLISRGVVVEPNVLVFT